MPLKRGYHSFDSHYTQIPNDWVRDSRLSLKAIGLLVQLISHNPGWKMSIRSLARANGTGVDTIKSAIVELETYGYLVRSEKQEHNDDGTFADYLWTTSDPFQNPVTVKPVHGKQDTKNTNSKNTNLKEIIVDQSATAQRFIEFWNIYPHRKGDARKPAEKSFSRLSVTNQKLAIEGARKLAENPAEPQFRPMAATWLNQERWTAELEPETAEPQEKDWEWGY